MTTLRLACQAMATRFELVLQGEDAMRLRAAGEEAFGEIRRLEAQLSFYRPTSDISRINARAAEAPVRVDPRLFALLQRAKALHTATDGAFDLTVGPLMKCWGFVNDSGHLPDPETLAEARHRTGMQMVHLDPERFTVSFERPGIMLDLGAIGKGYALDEAMALLQENGVTRALLHGGTSTVYALGTPLDEETWNIAVEYPDATESGTSESDVLTVVALENEALSVSAEWGKSFVADGQTYGHVLDPRIGQPVEGAVLAAVVTPEATEADALSTAFLVLGHELNTLDVLDRANLRTAVLFTATDGGAFDALHHRMPLRRSPKLRTSISTR